MNEYTRRRVIHGAAGTMAITTLAGCSGDGGNGDGDGNGDGTGDGGGDPQQIAADWASDAANFDGTGDIEDMTGQGSVTINNGDEVDGLFVMAPAVVRVDSGTEITWEWVSSGHTLTPETEEGATISDWQGVTEVSGEGDTHSVTFESTGVALYFCQPHIAQGQKGAVIVE